MMLIRLPIKSPDTQLFSYLTMSAVVRQNELSEEQILGILIPTLLVATFNGYIMVKELRKRCRGEAKFKHFDQKWISLLAVCWGILPPIACFLEYCPECGVYRKFTYAIFVIPQIVFVGFYQLSRLYHLFAHTQNKDVSGYPVVVYVFMFCWASAMVVIFGYIWGTEHVTPSNIHYVWFYPLWEFTTLSLLVYKLRSVARKNTENADYTLQTTSSDLRRNIRRKLSRVVLLTLFYLIPSIISAPLSTVLLKTAYSPISHTVLMLIISLYVVAVYLMLSHNTNEYIRFIRVIIALKLHYCCCDYRIALKQQSYFENEITRSIETFPLHIKSPFSTAVGDFTAVKKPDSDRLIKISSHSQVSPTPDGLGRYLPLEQTPSNSLPPEDDFIDQEFNESVKTGSGTFSFGVYLEYWRKDRRRVIPMYSTLKDELTQNKHYQITERQFVDLKAKCVVMLQRNSFKFWSHYSHTFLS